jgi:O-methyltransferase involved in polyketide biosynthesis
VSESVSPTAHYTGYVWARNGLSFPELETGRGRLMFESMRPLMVARSMLGEPTLEDYLLARHLALDATLARAIEEDGVSQVIEVAAGLSPRGTRFVERFGERLTYVEADLPDMAALKRRKLERMGRLSERHRVVDLDVLRDDGPDSLGSAGAALDPAGGLAILTEGLLGYFPTEEVLGMWRRFADLLGGFEANAYVCELHMGDIAAGPTARAFRLGLSAFVRGRVHLHFENERAAEAAARSAGFTDAVVTRADRVPGGRTGKGAQLVHVMRARVGGD